MEDGSICILGPQDHIQRLPNIANFVPSLETLITSRYVRLIRVCLWMTPLAKTSVECSIFQFDIVDGPRLSSSGVSDIPCLDPQIGVSCIVSSFKMFLGYF